MPKHQNSAMPEFSPREVLALSRLAALQGHAVGYREFERLAQDLDRRALRDVPIAGKMVSLWHARFPEGEVGAPNWPPRPHDVPALWLGRPEPEGSLSVLVVLGALTNGALSCLDEHGRSMVLRPEQARLGRLLTLNSDPLPPDSTTQAQALPRQDQGRPLRGAYRSMLVPAGLLLLALIARVLGRD